jgi:hypothetical protein
MKKKNKPTRFTLKKRVNPVGLMPRKPVHRSRGDIDTRDDSVTRSCFLLCQDIAPLVRRYMYPDVDCSLSSSAPQSIFE